MQQGKQHRGNGVMEKWSNEIFNTPSLPHSNTPTMAATRIRTPARSAYGFALYEVLLGVAIFAIGVVALGRAVQNCLQRGRKRHPTDFVRSHGGNSSYEGRA